MDIINQRSRIFRNLTDADATEQNNRRIENINNTTKRYLTNISKTKTHAKLHDAIMDDNKDYRASFDAFAKSANHQYSRRAYMGLSKG